MRVARNILILLLVAVTTAIGTARTRTTQSSMQGTRAVLAPMAPDSTVLDSLDGVDQSAITISGYSKRASDAKESFFVTNNTARRMSHIRVLWRYFTLSGRMLHERTETIEVNLRAGETRLVSLKTFDVQRLFYYYQGPKPRKSATPFQVAYCLVGYDVPIGR